MAFDLLAASSTEPNALSLEQATLSGQMTVFAVDSGDSRPIDDFDDDNNAGANMAPSIFGNGSSSFLLNFDNDDMDTKIILEHLRAANPGGANVSLDNLIAKYGSIRPPDNHEIVFLAISVAGLVLNIILFAIVAFCGRQSKQTRWVAPVLSQRPFVAILAFAHVVFCLVHVGEFFVVTLNFFEAWHFCLQFLKRRIVTNLCYLLIIGAVSLCALDNYIAVCHSGFHRFERARIKTAFAVFISFYCVAAIVVAFSDFVLPLSIEPKNCPGVSSLYLPTTSPTILATKANSSSSAMTNFPRDESGKVALSIFLLPSSVDFHGYCQLMDDCQLTTLWIEWTVLIVWALSASLNSFFYIRTAIVLRNSYEKIFKGRTVRASSSAGHLIVERVRSAVAWASSSHNNIGNNKDVRIENETTVETSELHSSFRGGNRPSSLRIQFSMNLSPTENEDLTTAADDLPSSPLPTLQRNGHSSLYRESSVFSFSLFSPRPSMDPSKSQQFRIYRARCRASVTMIIILAIFIVTWGPAVFFQIANAVFFTEEFRLEVLPSLLPVVRYFYLLLLLNAIIDPVVYCYGAPRKAKRFLLKYWQSLFKSRHHS